MKINLSSVKQVWNYRHEPENMLVLGDIFWKTILALCAIALIGALLLGMQELNAAENIQNMAQVPTSAPPPLDPKKLQSVVGTFTSRQAAYQDLSQSPAPQVADPSK